MPEDYRKLWNKFRQWLVDYKIEKTAERMWPDNYKNLDRYCIAINIDELLEKMTEFEKNGCNNGQNQSKKWAKSGQKSGHEFLQKMKN